MLKNRSIKGIIKGFTIAVVITLILLFLLSILMINLSLKEKSYFIFYKAITIAALVIGAAFAGKYSGSRGFIIGLIVGVMYSIFILITFGITKGNFNIQGYFLFEVLINIVVSGISGILGVNI